MHLATTGGVGPPDCLRAGLARPRFGLDHSFPALFLCFNFQILLRPGFGLARPRFARASALIIQFPALFLAYPLGYAIGLPGEKSLIFGV